MLFTPWDDNAQGIDVQAAVGLVEHGEFGLEHGHLKDFIALLFSRR